MIGHRDASQVHHAIDESWGLRQAGDALGRPGDLVDRGDRQSVILFAEAEDDELLVGHGTFHPLACQGIAFWSCSDKNAPHQIGPEQAIRRKHSDQSLSVIEAADRSDFCVALSAREQRWRRIDDIRHRLDNFPGAVGNDADVPAAHRKHEDFAGFVASLSSGKPSSARNETSGSSRSRSVTTPRTAVSDRATSEMRPEAG